MSTGRITSIRADKGFGFIKDGPGSSGNDIFFHRTAVVGGDFDDLREGQEVSFRTEPDPRHEPYDPNRDDVALTLIDLCVQRGVPLFGICRGLQEMNVAFGGSLHPEIRELPGRINHRMPRLENGEIHPDPEVVFADRHDVRLTPDGVFARLYGRDTIRVNSLHGQGILEPGPRVVVEGIADDGTIEAIRIKDAPNFALGVQWHAEYDPQRNPINRALFQAFGAALAARR